MPGSQMHKAKHTAQQPPAWKATTPSHRLADAVTAGVIRSLPISMSDGTPGTQPLPTLQAGDDDTATLLVAAGDCQGLGPQRLSLTPFNMGAGMSSADASQQR
jgi:hypothetical protein